MAKEIIEIKKNCENCIKKDACKFLSKYNELVRSNEFYSMFEYLEWNNLERIFKDNAVKYKCYSPAYSNGTLNIDVHPESVFEIAFKRHLNNKWEKYQYCNKKYDILDIEGNPVTVEMIIEKYEVKIVNELLLTPHQ